MSEKRTTTGVVKFAFLEALHDIEQVDLARRVHVRPNDQVPGGFTQK